MTDDADQIRSPRLEHDRFYRQFRDGEGVPVHTGVAVDDVRTVAVADWERTGGRGAFVNLDGMESVCDCQVHEIPAGEALRPQRHLHEMLVLVVAGAGHTAVGEGAARQSFEWGPGALFYVPHNTPYRLVNASGDEPARLLAATTLPMLYTLFRTDAAIWDVDCYDQWSHVDEGDYYSSVAELRSADDTRTYWDANVVPDVAGFDRLAEWSLRGEGNRSVFFPFNQTAMDAHVSEFDPGVYKKAHRHVSGANLLILSGEGYTLLWREGDDERQRVDWSPYTLLTPPTMAFHQHFNTSAEPARYVVLHGPQQRLGLQLYRSSVGGDPLPIHQIEYHEEDPGIREAFEAELAGRGVESRMGDERYEPPG